ncbi:MAG: DUF7507 domain-containing protein [Oceanihabitans sp.]
MVPFCSGDSTFALVKEGVFNNNDNDPCGNLGDTIAYTFTLYNTGNTTVNTISITDTMLNDASVTINGPTGDTNTDGILDLNETWEYTATYPLTQDDIDAGMVTNTATANGLAPDGTTPVTDISGTDVTNDTPTVVPFCSGDSTMVLSKTATLNDDGDGCAGIGDTINYEIRLTNTGNTTLNSIILTDTLLGGDITSTLSSGDINTNGLLDVNEEWLFLPAVYTITQADIDAGNITNIATADGFAPDGVTPVQATDTHVIDANNTEIPLCNESGMDVVKAAMLNDDGDGCAGVGDTITYTFTVTNSGDTSINITTINDTLLGGDITATVTLAGDTNADGLLNPTETWVYTALDYTITQADVDAGNITNTVTIDGLAPDGSNVPQATDTHVIDANNTEIPLCNESGMDVVKAAMLNDDGDGCAGVGDTITYTFTVTNSGDTSINITTINDTLLGGDITATVTLAGDTNADGLLNPTETWVYTALDYTITQADVDAGNITNTVTIDGLAPDGSNVPQATDTYIIDANNSEIPLCNNAAINIVKTGVFNNDNNNDCTEVDETITYTFVVTNLGDVSLENVVITDPLLDNATPPVNITLVSGDIDSDNELDPTETWTYTATYLVTQIDIDATEVINIATVNADDVVNHEPVSPVTSQTLTELIEDTTPPNTDACTVLDATLECDGSNNEALANQWNTDNIAALEACATDACDDNFEVTSNYMFANLVTTCGLGGTIDVIYTLTDATGNASTFNATLNLEDTIDPDISSCDVSDTTLECDGENNEAIADQWNADNIAALEACAADGCDNDFSGQVTSDYDFGNLTSAPGLGGMLDVEYTITDDCGNFTTLSVMLTLENTSVEAIDTALCNTSEVESQILDLFDQLSGYYDASGTWDVVSGNATLNGSMFDPLSVETGFYTFSYTENNSACPTYVEVTIEVHDRCFALNCGLDDVEISKAVTPNGDQYNEFFEVSGVELCGYTIEIQLFNRWGSLIYESHDYQNNWNGQASKNSIGGKNTVPTGTYYYIVKLKNSGIDPIQGYIYVGTK